MKEAKSLQSVERSEIITAPSPDREGLSENTLPNVQLLVSDPEEHDFEFEVEEVKLPMITLKKAKLKLTRKGWSLAVAAIFLGYLLWLFYP